MAAKFANIDEYIRLFPDEVQEILEQIRRTIRNAVPTADEVISYQMPTIRLDGQRLVHFAAWKHHVAIYPPIPTAEEPLEQERAVPGRQGHGEVFALGAHSVRRHRTTGDLPGATALGRCGLRVRTDGSDLPMSSAA